MKHDREIKAFLEKAKSLPRGELDAYEEFCGWLTERQIEVHYESAPKLGLKALVFADTHGCFEKRDAFEKFIYAHPQYDLCLLLGDHSYGDLDMILQYIPDHKIFGVLGNHDRMDLYERFGIRNHIHGQVMEFRGIRIAGIQGSHRYKSVNRPMLTQYESLQVAAELLEQYEAADILISHDKAFVRKEYDTAHVGLTGLNLYIDQAKPTWHIHGHYHENKEGTYANGTHVASVYQGRYLEL